MTWHEFRVHCKEYWFEMLTWAFMAILVFFAYVHGTHYEDSIEDAAITACERVNKRAGYERYRPEGYKGILGTETRVVCLP
ncbi:MAG TPA: hypothetical protein VEA37_11695 [Flavobacterium sp.]|nr:hypothetical protein [Flavobacterium sp.]